MVTRSLKRRFLLVSATVSAVALCAAGLFLYYLFDRDIRERVHAEIHHNLTQLPSSPEIDASGTLAREPIVTAGPSDRPVILHSTLVTLGEGKVRRQLMVMIAVNEDEVRVPSWRFARDLGLFLCALALAIVLTSSAQLTLVMLPLKRLRHSIREIRHARESRVSGDYPVEIRPVVNA